jgi:hypothetical protein
MKKQLTPNKESERIFIQWLKMIRENEKYYFAKSMDLFSRLPTRHQSGLIKHLAEKEDQTFWLENIEDTTSYRDVLRSILFYYSGREMAGDPTKKKFAAEIAAFVRSKDFIGAGAVAEASEFKNELESL